MPFKNREEEAAQRGKYYGENRDERREYARKYNEANREKLREYQHEYRTENHEKARKSARKSYAGKRSITLFFDALKAIQVLTDVDHAI